MSSTAPIFFSSAIPIYSPASACRPTSSSLNVVREGWKGPGALARHSGDTTTDGGRPATKGVRSSIRTNPDRGAFMMGSDPSRTGSALSSAGTSSSGNQDAYHRNEESSKRDEKHDHHRVLRARWLHPEPIGRAN